MLNQFLLPRVQVEVPGASIGEYENCGSTIVIPDQYERPSVRQWPETLHTDWPEYT